ncbi:MAG: hypothetical protein PHN75_07235 [Syntrophales bacterium]|nr:hypothetical protein [Syntrophales bacterium]
MKINGPLGKILSVVLMALAASAFNPCPSPGADEIPRFKECAVPGNYFKCRIPADWSVYDPGFGLSAEEKKVFGVTLFGPREAGPVSSVISIHYYAPGNLLHKTMEAYIRRHAQPVLGAAAEGASFGRIQPVEIAGRHAQAFERIDIRYVGERRMNPAKISLYEKFIVIPAGSDAGFYALVLSVPEDRKDRLNGIFAEVVKSFSPQR